MWKKAIWGRCCWQSNFMQHVNTHGTRQASTSRSTAHHNNTLIAANLTIIKSVICPHITQKKWRKKIETPCLSIWITASCRWNHPCSRNSFPFSVNKRWQGQHQSARLAHIVPKELGPSAWTLKFREGRPCWFWKSLSTLRLQCCHFPGI